MEEGGGVFDFVFSSGFFFFYLVVIRVGLWVLEEVGLYIGVGVRSFREGDRPRIT